MPNLALIETKRTRVIQKERDHLTPTLVLIQLSLNIEHDSRYTHKDREGYN